MHLGADSLAPRLAWIRKVTDAHLVRHDLTGQILQLMYRHGAYEELCRIVGLERACCAFLDFRLERNTEGCTLTITSSEGSDESAAWLFAQFLPDVEGGITSNSCGCGPGQCG